MFMENEIKILPHVKIKECLSKQRSNDIERPYPKEFRSVFIWAFSSISCFIRFYVTFFDFELVYMKGRIMLIATGIRVSQFAFHKRKKL